jgi:hypothetical protein
MNVSAMTIAGSDPSGGAGLQADLKTFQQLGVYGSSAVTLITVQNTTGVQGIELLDPELVLRQIEAIVSDIPPAAAKTGALGSEAVIRSVAELAQGFDFPLVVDPVMVSKHGAPLLPSSAMQALREALLPQAFLITPNLHEAAALLGKGEVPGEVRWEAEDVRQAAEAAARARRAPRLAQRQHPGRAVGRCPLHRRRVPGVREPAPRDAAPARQRLRPRCCDHGRTRARHDPAQRAAHRQELRHTRDPPRAPARRRRAAAQPLRGPPLARLSVAPPPICAECPSPVPD